MCAVMACDWQLDKRWVLSHDHKTLRCEWQVVSVECVFR
jgi:hypothetical protein